jgi:hypothetical protein
MTNHNDETAALARQIAAAETKLQQLEAEIAEIGQPAAHQLQRRLDALKIEENALARNLREALEMENPDPRMTKIRALLAYIQTEETELGREADFLHQSPPSSGEFAIRTGSQMLESCRQAIRRVIGGHHPLGMSAFVNHSIRDLAARRE